MNAVVPEAFPDGTPVQFYSRIPMLQQGNTIVHCTSTPLVENFMIGDVLMSFKGLADGFSSMFGFYLLVLDGIRIQPLGVGSDLFVTGHSDPVW